MFNRIEISLMIFITGILEARRLKEEGQKTEEIQRAIVDTFRAASGEHPTPALMKMAEEIV